MTVAVIWVSKKFNESTEKDAIQAGRFIAASGHSLLIFTNQELSLKTAEAYDAGNGTRLVGISTKSTSSQIPKANFNEVIWIDDQNEVPKRIIELIDISLFIGDPTDDPHLHKWVQQSSKPAYAVINGEIRPNPGDGEIRFLPSLEAFARELAKNISQEIISKPDPMKTRFRKFEND